MTRLAIKILSAQVIRNAYAAYAPIGSGVAPQMAESAGRLWFIRVKRAENSKR